MIILCWIEVPPGWRCEIKTSDGVVRPWTGDKPVGASCKFRVWNPKAPRDAERDPWMLPGEFEGIATGEARDAVKLAVDENEARFNRPKYVRWVVDERQAKKKKPVA